eukprot:1440231-Lingulodinium_polyedra.AAC.1
MAVPLVGIERCLRPRLRMDGRRARRRWVWAPQRIEAQRRHGRRGQHGPLEHWLGPHCTRDARARVHRRFFGARVGR